MFVLACVIMCACMCVCLIPEDRGLAQRASSQAFKLSLLLVTKSKHMVQIVDASIFNYLFKLQLPAAPLDQRPVAIVRN